MQKYKRNAVAEKMENAIISAFYRSRKSMTPRDLAVKTGAIYIYTWTKVGIDGWFTYNNDGSIKEVKGGTKFIWYKMASRKYFREKKSSQRFVYFPSRRPKRTQINQLMRYLWLNKQ